MKKPVNFKLEEETIELLSELTLKLGLTRADVMRGLLEGWIEDNLSALEQRQAERRGKCLDRRTNDWKDHTQDTAYKKSGERRSKLCSRRQQARREPPDSPS